MSRTLRALAAVVVIAAAPAVAGCGASLTGLGFGAAAIFGGDSSGGATNAGSTIVPIIEDRSASRSVTLRLVAIDNESDPVAVLVEGGPRGSGTFVPAVLVSTAATTPGGTSGTIAPAPVTGVALGLGSSPGGIAHNVVWDGDAQLPQNPRAHELTIRYTIVDPVTLAPKAAPISFDMTVGNDAPVVTVQADELPATAGGVLVVPFNISDTTTDRCTGKLEFALASSPTAFAVAEVVVGTLTGLESFKGSPGRRHSVGWQTDADPPGGIRRTIQDDVIVRLTVRDNFDAESQPVTFTIDIRNNLPPAVQPVAFDPSREAGSPIPIAYTVFDQDGDLVDVKVEVSVDGGPYRRATERAVGKGDRDVSDGGIARPSGPFPTGASHRFLWDKQADVPTTKTDVVLRFTPSDENGAGLAVSTPPLEIASQFAMDHEPGSDPGSERVEAGFFDNAFSSATADFPHVGRPSLIGAVGGRLTMQDLNLPGDAGFAPRQGFLPRREIQAFDGTGFRFVTDVDDFRVGSFNGAGQRQGIVAWSKSMQRLPVALGNFVRGFNGIPEFEYTLALVPPGGVDPDPDPPNTAGILDLQVGDLDQDGVDDVVVLYGMNDDLGFGFFTLRAEAYFRLRDVPSTFVLPQPVAEITTIGGWFLGKLALGNFDGDAAGTLDVAIAHEGAFGTADNFAFVATNALVFPPSFPTEPVTCTFTPAPILNDACLYYLFRADAADLDGDARDDLVVSCESDGQTSDRNIITYRLDPGLGQLQFLEPNPCGGGAASDFFGAGIVLAVADFTGEGKEELVAGGRVFLSAPEPSAVVFELTEVDGVTHVAEVARLADGSDGRAAATADLDQDGDIDIALVTADGAIRLLFNDGFGRFTESQVFQSPAGSTSVFAVDADRDGDMDVVASHPAASNLYRNYRPLNYGQLLMPAPAGFEFDIFERPAVADLDGDRRNEVIGIALAFDGSLIRDFAVARQLLDGTLAPFELTGVTVSGEFGDKWRRPTRVRRLAARDGVAFVHHDTTPGSEGDPVRVLAENANGALAVSGPIAGTDAGCGLDAADLNADGRDDLIMVRCVGSFSGGLEVSLQQAGLAFGAPAALSTGSGNLVEVVRIVDYDGDHAADILAGGAEEVSLWRGVPGDTGVGVTLVAVLPLPFDTAVDMAVEDLTGDGRKDVVIYTLFGGVEVHAAGADGVFALISQDYITPCIVIGASLGFADLNADGRKDLVLASFEDCSDAEPYIYTATAKVDSGSLEFLPYTFTLLPGFDTSLNYPIGAPVYWDFDEDGRMDVAFPNGNELVGVFPRASGTQIINMRQFVMARQAIFDDVTSDGAPDLVAFRGDGFASVMVEVEHRKPAGSFVGLQTPEPIESTRAPIAGAKLALPAGGIGVRRTVEMLPWQPLDLPPVATVSATPFETTIHVPITPAILIAPEPQTLPAVAILEIPVDDVALEVVRATLAGGDDSDNAILALVKVFRYEREQDGGYGRTVEVLNPMATFNSDDGRRKLRFQIDRFGIYQGAAVATDP